MQTLVVPALVALSIFLVTKFVALPVWRRYRQRYGQYLPVGISAHTMGLRDRFHTACTGFIMRRRNRAVAGDDASDDGFMEDGEELGNVDGAWGRAARREDAGHSDRRLSRE